MLPDSSAMTVAGSASPSCVKIWVMPALVPQRPMPAAAARAVTSSWQPPMCVRLAANGCGAAACRSGALVHRPQNWRSGGAGFKLLQLACMQRAPADAISRRAGEACRASRAQQAGEQPQGRLKGLGSGPAAAGVSTAQCPREFKELQSCSQAACCEQHTLLLHLGSWLAQAPETSEECGVNRRSGLMQVGSHQLCHWFGLLCSSMTAYATGLTLLCSLFSRGRSKDSDRAVLRCPQLVKPSRGVRPGSGGACTGIVGVLAALQNSILSPLYGCKVSKALLCTAYTMQSPVQQLSQSCCTCRQHKVWPGPQAGAPCPGVVAPATDEVR